MRGKKALTGFLVLSLLLTGSGLMLFESETARADTSLKSLQELDEDQVRIANGTETSLDTFEQDTDGEAIVSRQTEDNESYFDSESDPSTEIYKNLKNYQPGNISIALSAFRNDWDNARFYFGDNTDQTSIITNDGGTNLFSVNGNTHSDSHTYYSYKSYINITYDWSNGNISEVVVDIPGRSISKISDIPINYNYVNYTKIWLNGGKDPALYSITLDDVNPKYSISLKTNGQGYVSKDPNKTDYSKGTEVTLNATPDMDSIFTGWTGDINSNDKSIKIIMDQDYNITANFELKRTLNISVEGPGSSDPKGYNEYGNGTEVTLNATPDMDSIFTGWTGDINSNDKSIKIIMDQDYNITANFVEPPSINVTNPEDSRTYYSETNITVEWTGSGGSYNISSYGFRYYKNSSQGNYTDMGLNNSINITISDYSTYYIEVIAYDTEGYNTTDYIEIELIADPGPAVKILYPEPNREFKELPVAVEWTGYEGKTNITRYEIRVYETSEDPVEWQNIGLNTTHNLTDLGDGEYTIEVRAVDETNKTGTETVQIELKTGDFDSEIYRSEYAPILAGGLILLAILIIARASRSNQGRW